MTNPPDGKTSRQALLAQLRREICRVEQARIVPEGTVSSGCPALDACLPDGGLIRGTLVEWLGDEGGGAETLALLAAREAAAPGGAIVVVDRQRGFYPPAARRLGIELERLILVQPTRTADEVWALDQALRCAGVAAAVASIAALGPRNFRRLQLAAEAGGVLGLLVRTADARGDPSWAELRIGVEPLPAPNALAKAGRAASLRQKAAASGSGGRWLQLEVLRCRRGAAGARVVGVLDDETHPLYLASPMGEPTAARRRAR